MNISTQPAADSLEFGLGFTLAPLLCRGSSCRVPWILGIGPGGTDVWGLVVAPWNMVKRNIETVNKNRGSKHCVASIQQETCFHLSCRLKSQILSLEWKPSRQTMLRCFQMVKELRSIQDACKQFFLANYQAWWSQVAHPQIPQISSAWRCGIFKEVILVLGKLKFPQVLACSESLTFNSRYFWSIS